VRTRRVIRPESRPSRGSQTDDCRCRLLRQKAHGSAGSADGNSTGSAASMANSLQFPQHAAPRLMLAIVLVSLVQALSPAVRAETRVSGDTHALHLDLRDATVEEALTALGAEFDVRRRTLAILDRRITGTYNGSLRQVISRLLNGYDFVMKTSSNRVELFVFGAGTRAPATSPLVNQDVASGDSPSVLVQVVARVATATGPNRRRRPR
jgi:hypothetical protein